ncbi:substrate-binding domain-containing protein [Gorillibacterium sp. sgz5001074]|uniref:substrate-binding domain-containing protein n=1 Tax=Gorillibacterium sp. sgz5001074 TaxID=3446695 RepID=UPI003F661607
MPDEISYTTEEIAKLLRVSKLTVYDLIKKGDLPAYRVGKQMRVDASDLDTYKSRAKTGLPSFMNYPGQPDAQPAQAYIPAAGAPAPTFRPLVITGQDHILDILAQHIEKTNKNVRPLRSFVGSLDSLISMYHGESDIVSTHLFDGNTGEYNLPYIQKLLIGCPYVVVNLASRWAGLYTAPGNPYGITAWEHLAKPGITIVNRERGSGARVLLEEQLRIRGISPRSIQGYQLEESNHLGVAGKIARGEADAGVGIEKAAAMVGIGFVPLIQERYDLVMLKKPGNLEWIDTVKRILQSEAFRKELQSISGYDLAQTGHILWETD